MTIRGLMIAVAAMLSWCPVNQSLAQDDQPPPLISIVGIPYLSTTGSGDVFAGTIDIDAFEARHTPGAATSTAEELFAQGILRFGNRALPFDFPVNVLRADCFVLELEIGPPDFRGLQTPLVIVETPGDSELRRADFCENGRALAAGDFAELASLLNEEDLLAAGFLGGNSCTWYDALECETVYTVCAADCALGSLSCVNCIDKFSDTCIDCLCPDCCEQVPPETAGCG